MRAKQAGQGIVANDATAPEGCGQVGAEQSGARLAVDTRQAHVHGGVDHQAPEIRRGQTRIGLQRERGHRRRAGGRRRGAEEVRETVGVVADVRAEEGRVAAVDAREIDVAQVGRAQRRPGVVEQNPVRPDGAVVFGDRWVGPKVRGVAIERRSDRIRPLGGRVAVEVTGIGVGGGRRKEDIGPVAERHQLDLAGRGARELADPEIVSLPRASGDVHHLDGIAIDVVGLGRAVDGRAILVGQEQVEVGGRSRTSGGSPRTGPLENEILV